MPCAPALKSWAPSSNRRRYGDKIAIAGRVWIVEEVDHRRREVFCTLVKGNIPAYFGDVAGDIHTRILERMYGVLDEQKSYPYLMRHAVCRLQEARESFAKSGMRDHPLVHLGWEHVGAVPLAGQLRLPRVGAFLEDPLRETAGFERIRFPQTLSSAIYHESQRGRLLPDHGGRGRKGLRSP